MNILSKVFSSKRQGEEKKCPKTIYQLLTEVGNKDLSNTFFRLYSDERISEQKLDLCVESLFCTAVAENKNQKTIRVEYVHNYGDDYGWEVSYMQNKNAQRKYSLDYLMIGEILGAYAFDFDLQTQEKEEYLSRIIHELVSREKKTEEVAQTSSKAKATSVQEVLDSLREDGTF